MNLIDQITQDLALRAPQKAALSRVDKVLAGIPDLQAPLTELEGDISVGGFERFDTSFPSFCFHIATAVGKTRLMGACIAYLYHTQGWRNFFVLTKGSTIYEKTIANFSKGNPKYVLQGYTDLPDFEVITGDNYERADVGNRLQRLPGLGEYINIFIFNVEKLFDNRNEQRRFRTANETLGGSLAELLAAQPDLVLLMDESHRYRATASMQTVNDLKPVLGLEFTATPTSKNVIYRYDLGQAIRDSQAHLDDSTRPSGYIKVPVVLGRRDMHISSTAFDGFEEIQLSDGISRHRQKKTDLEAYIKNNNLPPLLPVVLISTKNIDHANQIREKIESDDFFNGEYRGKTVVTHSRTGDLSDEDIQGLIRLEDTGNDKEIVIHVNKLREGWDVKNVYTIIPLRAAKSVILTEQTIGRGLRLPFGVQTGNEDLDTLEITAHEHFAEIVREAHSNVARTGLPIRTKEITEKEKEEKEVRTIAPINDSPFLIEVPRIEPSYIIEGQLTDFAIIPSRSFSAVSPTLVGVTLGGSEQRTFNVPLYEMSEDPVLYLIRVVFDKCGSISVNDSNDRKLVPDLIRRYLGGIDGETAWKSVIRAHSAEIVDDITTQIKKHVVAKVQITWVPTGDTLTWREWHASVPKGYTPPHFQKVPEEECVKCPISGYTRTIYPEGMFDSKQEKWLADIMEKEKNVLAWLRVPTGQMEIFHGAGDYNPDLIADDGQTIYLIEVKAANQITEETVLRKAAAAIDWCKAATETGLNGRKWVYRLVPHDCIEPTDSFTGVMSKALRLEENKPN